MISFNCSAEALTGGAAGLRAWRRGEAHDVYVVTFLDTILLGVVAYCAYRLGLSRRKVDRYPIPHVAFHRSNGHVEKVYCMDDKQVTRMETRLELAMRTEEAERRAERT